MQEKTTNPPPPRTQKGVKTLNNPHQCLIPPRGGGGVGVSIDRCIINALSIFITRGKRSSSAHEK